MKKLSLILGMFLFIVQGAFQSAFAMPTEANYYCAKEPYDLSGGLSGFVASASGANFFATQIAEKELEKALKRELGADFKVKIETFGGNNLLNGKFKKLTAVSNDLNRNGFHFSSMNAETLCGFNHVKYENNTLYFVENMVIKYQGKITEADLQKTIASTEYSRLIDNFTISAGGSLVVKVLNTNVKIENNKVVMSYDILAPTLLGTIPKTIKFAAGLNVEDGKIKFDNIDFGNPLTNITMNSALPMINKLNPLVYQIKTDKKSNAIVNVKNVKIVNNEILTDGLIILPKNYQNNGAN